MLLLFNLNYNILHVNNMLDLILKQRNLVRLCIYDSMPWTSVLML